MMTKSEQLIRSTLGPVRADIRPLACAVNVAEELLFYKDISMDDIHVTEMVYPAVAGQIKRTPSTASRRVERLANLCWDTLWKEDWLSNTLESQ